MKVITIPTAKIVVGPRLRAADYDKLEGLEQSIAKSGLINPITVGPETEDGYPLIAGLHRLMACKRLGLAEIDVSVIEGPELELQLIEVDENLVRVSLTAAQRGTFTQRRKEIYEMLHPETKHGGDRRSPEFSNPHGADLRAKSFTEDTAEKTGVSRATVERNARRGANIPPDVLEVVQGTYFDQGRHLDALARLPPDEQREIARLVEQGDNDEAMGALIPELQVMRRGRSDYRDLVMAWNKANTEAREQFVEKKARELEKAVRPKAKPALSIVRNTED